MIYLFIAYGDFFGREQYHLPVARNGNRLPKPFVLPQRMANGAAKDFFNLLAVRR
jgi:hypothetical protein